MMQKDQMQQEHVASIADLLRMMVAPESEWHLPLRAIPLPGVSQMPSAPLVRAKGTTGGVARIGGAGAIDGGGDAGGGGGEFRG